MADRESLNVSCVENLIFNLLLNSEHDYDYPNLVEDSVENIASNLVDVIDVVLKQKSVVSSARRTNLLRFVNIVCQTNESHVDPKSYKIYLDAFKSEHDKSLKSHEILDFLEKNQTELNHIVSKSICDDVAKFYKRKNSKKKEKSTKLEYIKHLDQERLKNSNLKGAQASRHFNFFETTEDIIFEFLDNTSTTFETDNNRFSKNNEDNLEYREKQTKFCYALINVGDSDDFKILDIILNKFLSYKTLERFEVNFLTYLWTSDQESCIPFGIFITDNFPIVIEKAILKLGTEILRLGQDESEITLASVFVEKTIVKA